MYVLIFNHELLDTVFIMTERLGKLNFKKIKLLYQLLTVFSSCRYLIRPSLNPVQNFYRMKPVCLEKLCGFGRWEKNTVVLGGWEKIFVSVHNVEV